MAADKKTAVITGGASGIGLACATLFAKDGYQIALIVAADGDGVVIVPRANAEKVLALAQEMDFKEHSMYSIIEKYKSIQEAVKRFGRL
jgi:NAD(P)-dependent dehydrogenase (short-subunit alcohol dehydrogenase family)